MNTNQQFLSFGQTLKTIDIFDNTLSNLAFQQDQPKSAVALIVKKTKKVTSTKHNDSFVHDQILLLQRKVSPKDRFSGQICFPGGRQQPNQILLNVAIRQTYEQTNIQLKPQHLIGCIKRQVNFIISTKKQQYQKQTQQNSQRMIKKIQKQMVIYAFVFIVDQDQILSQQIILNKDEMQTYKWVSAIQLMSDKNICWLDYSEKLLTLVKVYQQSPFIKNHTNSALNCVNRALSTALDFKMGQKVYGITLYIILIILTGFDKKIEQYLNKSAEIISESYYYNLKQLLYNIRQIKSQCSAYIVFEIKDPITDQFRMFQKALFEGMYKMRPKL